MKLLKISGRWENEDLIDLLIQQKTIPVLVEKCKDGNLTQLQALWALSNITSGTSELAWWVTWSSF